MNREIKLAFGQRVIASWETFVINKTLQKHLVNCKRHDRFVKCLKESQMIGFIRLLHMHKPQTDVILWSLVWSGL